MSIKRYMKDYHRIIINLLVVTAIVDLVAASSAPISASLWDIAYMDALIFISSAVFLGFDYRNRKRDYEQLVKAIEKGGAVDGALPLSDQLEAELIRSIVELKNLQLGERTKELQSSLDEINDYITKWVHEIKIPIAVCELIAEKLNDLQLPEAAGNIPEELRLELDRIRFLVNQVLYASRASSYPEDLEIREVNLDKAVREVVRRNTSFFISKRLDLKLENLNHDVLTDMKWIQYIIEQIINNACKYVDIGGEIIISCRESDRQVKLSIRDNGVGIAPKDIGRVFDKGFTGENGRKAAKSTGMGMYYSKKMADKLNHELAVTSEQGSYTEFSIIFYKLSDYFKVTKM